MLFLSILCLLATSGYVPVDCSGGCKEPTLFYEGLGCKPMYASPSDSCPSEFDCLHITERAAAKEKKCYVNGKTYTVGDYINNNEIFVYGYCACTCRRKPSGNMGFTCPSVDWIDRHAKPGCHLTYELGECSSVGEACAPFAATCEVAGKTYHEGQEFNNPNVKCTNCVCGKGWQGKFEAPFCKKATCTQNADQVHSFCAPSYITLDDCCPFNWICPANDKIVAARTAYINPNLKCKFGDKTLNVGDKFDRTDGAKGKLSCECRIPPYLTCIQNFDYPGYPPE